ncbi:zinc finger protein 436-like [Acanthochromis polyacanthus]|nr:zinc finger protein 436-like [Acanthochromis polyacanthus]
MSSVQNLRELINERLTAAAEEIFTEFEKTIVQYEEEIDRQRRLLDNIWKPQITQHTADLPQHNVCQKEEVLPDQQLRTQEMKSNLDKEGPEHRQVKEEQEELCISVDQEDQKPPQLKEVQEELCTSQKGEQQETYTFMLLQCKSKCEELSEEIFRVFEKAFIQHEEEIDRQRRLLDVFWKSEIPLHTTDLPQPCACTEAEVLTVQLFKLKRNTSLDQEDPELPQMEEEQKKLCNSLDQEDPQPPQIKQEQEEFCTSLEGEQFTVKQETDAFMVTSTYEESDHSDTEPNSVQLFSHIFPVAESPDQAGNKHLESGLSRNAELERKKRHKRNSNYNNNVDILSMSESHCDTDTEKETLICEVCGKAFKDKSNLKRHYRIHAGVKPFHCKTCGKSFSQSNHLKVHVRIHTGEKPYLCNSCGNRFSDHTALKRHTAIHTGELYACEICSKNFSDKGPLKVHMRIHTGEKKYLCNTCGKQFSDLSTLKRHNAIHTGVKPYLCNTCGKCFSDVSTFNRHKASHTGEKPFLCNTCGRRFHTFSHLMRHMAVHTGEKPYSCNICGKCFSQSGNLKVHMRIHTGEMSSS